METPELIETDFEQLYLAVREYEGRVYTDAEIARLPEVDTSHKYYNEWQVRKHSADRLVSYLEKKKKPLKILEVGCGNGWLAAKLANIPGAKVTGLDINLAEISQARRVFKKDNLQFINDSIDGDMIKHIHFDMVIFAAVLPYFPFVQNTLNAALGRLYSRGEIHITDTNFYREGEVAGALKRCVDYYDMMGFPQMADSYHHHTLNVLKDFKAKVLFNPGSILNRFGKKEPFYWICIKN
jgi:ubiquinone/menaquinone biosynthesis C-methylase UbiE